MAMMKAIKAKRYVEGGDVKPKDPTKLVMPGADYVPGVSAEHLYFQPDTQKIAENAAAAASAAPVSNAAPPQQPSDMGSPGNAKGGVIKMKKMAMGGAVKSGRGDGCAARGKTKGRMV